MAEYKMLMDPDDGEALFVTKTGDEFVLEMTEELSTLQIEDVVMDIVVWLYEHCDKNLFLEVVTEGIAHRWESFMMYALPIMVEWSEDEEEVAVAGNVEIDGRE